MTEPTCGRDDVAVVVAVVGQLEAAGQREVLGQLHRVLLLPLVDQVVRRPTVWKIHKERIRIPFWLSSMIGIEMSGDFFHPCFRPFPGSFN